MATLHFEAHHGKPEPLYQPAVATKIRRQPSRRPEVGSRTKYQAAPALGRRTLKQTSVAPLPTRRREEVARYTRSERMEASVTEANLLTEEEFRAFLRKNARELDKSSRELSSVRTGGRLARRSSKTWSRLN